MIVNNCSYQNRYICDISEINKLARDIGKKTKLANNSKNYTEFNLLLVNRIVQYREKAIPSVLNVLKNSQDEKTIAESIYILDKMVDAGVKGIDKVYPVLSEFNNTESPTIQVLLAGVYRKTQIPDAFGPLCKMMIRNSLKQDYPYFDPIEEIGGAVLEYIRNKNAVNEYNKISR